MHIRWTPAAAADLHAINDYLKEHHPHYRLPTMRQTLEYSRGVHAPWRLISAIHSFQVFASARVSVARIRTSA